MPGRKLNEETADCTSAGSESKLIILVAGSEYEAFRLAPLCDSLSRNMVACEPPLLVGVNYYPDYAKFGDAIESRKSNRRSVCLGVNEETCGRQTGKALVEIEKVILEQHPDLVILCGESNLALAAAISASQNRIPVANVCSGLRSGDTRSPEETVRSIIDRVCALHFTICEDANIHLLREGIAEESIHFVGNILVDALRGILPELDIVQIPAGLGVESGEYSLVELHQPDHSSDAGWTQVMVSILDGLASLAPVVLTVHPAIRDSILRMEQGFGSGSVFDNPKIRISGSPNLVESLKLIRESAVVITDSGRVQEETTCLGVPCITVTRRTLQPATSTDGTNVLTGLNPDKVVAYAAECLGGSRVEGRKPLLWDGGTADRIAGSVESFLSISAEPRIAGDKSLREVSAGRS